MLHNCYRQINLLSKKKIDENLLDKFEELLIESDVGPAMAAQLKNEFKKEKIYWFKNYKRSFGGIGWINIEVTTVTN